MYTKRFETTTTNKYIEVAMRYDKGGMNYFSGQNQPRGYYIGVTPVEIADGFKSMMACSGYCTCVLPVQRASLRGELAADDLVRAREAEMVAAVCEKNGLTLR